MYSLFFRFLIKFFFTIHINLYIFPFKYNILICLYIHISGIYLINLLIKILFPLMPEKFPFDFKGLPRIQYLRCWMHNKIAPVITDTRKVSLHTISGKTAFCQYQPQVRGFTSHAKSHYIRHLSSTIYMCVATHFCTNIRTTIIIIKRCVNTNIRKRCKKRLITDISKKIFLCNNILFILTAYIN